MEVALPAVLMPAVMESRPTTLRLHLPTRAAKLMRASLLSGSQQRQSGGDVS
jgi:hypothetical protein